MATGLDCMESVQSNAYLLVFAALGQLSAVGRCHAVATLVVSDILVFWTDRQLEHAPKDCNNKLHYRTCFTFFLHSFLALLDPVYTGVPKCPQQITV